MLNHLVIEINKPIIITVESMSNEYGKKVLE